MRIRILPYKIGSASATLLSRALGGLKLRPNGTYLPRSGDFIINWGSSAIPPWFDRIDQIRARLGTFTFLNKPTCVLNASNKLRTFRILQEAGVAVPEFQDARMFASDWEGTVYARHILTGHSGAGIEVIAPGTDMLPNAPLYVKGIENHGEYRVHVVNGQVIDYIKKRRRNGEPATEEQLAVRNLANGWVYTRENLRRLERIEQLAISAVSALGLDFGAVDIIKDENGDVFVLEVNTACGMSETTLNSYVSAFSSMIQEYATR